MALLSGYSYRKRITIAGSSGAGTGYQVLLKIGESAGSSGADFHLEGHALNFPNDLRFTSSDGTTQYSYWIESIEGTSPNRLINVWVKIDDSLDTNTDIYVYYGKSGDTSVSNGDTTFLLFDDFDGSAGSAPDASKWEVLKSHNTCTVELDGNSSLHLAGEPNVFSSGAVRTLMSFTNGIALRLKHLIDEDKYAHVFLGSNTLIYTDTHITLDFSYKWHWQSPVSAGDSKDIFYTRWDNGAYTFLEYITTTTPLTTANEWHILDHIYTTSGKLDWYHDGTQWVTTQDTTYLNTVKYWLIEQGEYTTGPGGNRFIDYAFVRKYIEPEPSFSISGAEETQPIGVSVSFGIGSVIHTNYFRTNNAVLFNEINSALKNNIAQAIETNIQKQKNTSIFAQLQSMVNQKIDSDIQMRYFKQSFNSGLVENISLNSQSASKEIQVSKQDTKHVANIARLSSFILSSISALQNILNEIQKFNSLSADLETLLRKNILAEASTQNTVIQEVSSFVEIISGVLVSHNIPTLIELQSEIINHINSLKEISSAYSKQTGPIIDIGSDILQSISLALETSSELETKLSEVTEILKQITKKASTKASIDNVIKMNLNILTEIVESASELIQILRTVGEKITIFRTTIDILRHTDN
jgi:type III secretion system FlhB-like substrate exporter